MAQRRREKQQLARLCDLVADSLLPHLEPEAPAPRRPQLTPQDERRILLALTRVNKTIRGWDEKEQGCELDQEIVSCSAAEKKEIVSCLGEVHSCCLPPDQHFDDGFSCLANIVSILVGFLHFHSDYVTHSTGNILIAISNSLMKFEIVWMKFIELVWTAIRTVSARAHTDLPSIIESSSCFGTSSNCFSSVVESVNSDINTSSTSITSFMAVLQLRCLSISVPMMASLFRVLHAILKFLKITDCELKDDFICLSVHHIQKIHWDSCHQLNAGEHANLVKDDRYSSSNDSAQLGILSGSILQLLCSLVEQSDLEDTDGRDMLVKLVDVIPKLAASLQVQQDIPKSLFQYSKHKILMVMVRLKPYLQQNCSYLVSWLKLLRCHFQDLLHEPMSQHIAKSDNCLEGSPFLLSIIGLGELQNKSTLHLQRQAIYLFVSCCICLAYCGNNTRIQCSCKRDDLMVGHKVQDCSDHCDCFGLSEISEWFQRSCLDNTFGSKSSTDITLCFLQLYIEEVSIILPHKCTFLENRLLCWVHLKPQRDAKLIMPESCSSIFSSLPLSLSLVPSFLS